MEASMKTDYNELLPFWVHFNIAELDELHIIKKDMAKKLFAKGLMKKKLIGNKVHVTRIELIRYLESEENEEN